MNTQPNQPDTAIDKTLAALNSATPPQGLESRIAAHLAQATPAPARPVFRDRLTPAWWSGAVTGATFALLAVAAVLLLQRAFHKTPPAQTASITTPTVSRVALAASTPPCAHPAILRTHAPSASPVATPATGVAAPSHPAPVLPLTPQERELALLARTADPRALASLSSDHEAKLEAQNAADFDKFFAPPPAPPTSADTPTPTPESVPAPTPEAAPADNPDTNPSADQ